MLAQCHNGASKCGHQHSSHGTALTFRPVHGAFTLYSWRPRDVDLGRCTSAVPGRKQTPISIKEAAMNRGIQQAMASVALTLGIAMIPAEAILARDDFTGPEKPAGTWV